MAERIPYNPVPSVASQDNASPGQNISASPEAFGADTAQATQRLGNTVLRTADTVADIAIQQQQRFNQVATDEAFNQFQTGVRVETYGDPNNPTQRGFYSMQGREALDNYQARAAAVEDRRKRIREGLQNDAQRIAFDTMSRRYATMTLESMGRYADTQSKAWGATVQQATTANSLQAISDGWNSDQTFVTALEQGRTGAVRHVQEQFGVNTEPAVIDNAIRDFTTKAVTARIYGMSATAPGQAEAWLKSGTVPEPGTGKPVPVQQAIDPRAYAMLLQHVEGKGDQEIGAQAAARAFAGSGSTAGGSFADRIIQRESGGHADATDAGSSAAGYGGFIKDTWRQFAHENPALFAGKTDDQILAMRSDRGLVAQAINWYAAKNAPALQAAGLPATPENLAIAHAGVGNAIALLKADPNVPASAVLSSAVITANPTWGKMTAGQLVQVLGAAGQGTALPNAPAPPGAVNNAPDHTTDRAAGYGLLIAQLQRGEINDRQFSIALTRLQQMQAIDAKIKSDAAEQAQNEYIPQILKDPGAFNRNTMLDDPRLTGAQKSAIDTILHRALKGDVDKPTEVSQAKRTELLDGIRTGTITSPDQILDAVAHGGLSTNDYNFVRARFDESQTENGRSLNRQTNELFGAVEKALSTSVVAGLQNPYAGIDMLKYKNFAYAKIAAAQKEGPAKVAALFDPNSKDFLGSEAIIAQFKSPMDEVMRRRMEGLGTAVVPQQFSTPDSLREGVASGKISRADAAKIAIQKGWMRPNPTTPGPQVPTQ